MNSTLCQKEDIITKALKNRVITENIANKLNTEEIIYFNRLMHINKNFSIESLLADYISLCEISNDYKYYLISKGNSEKKFKQEIEVILKNAFVNLPVAVYDFIYSYLINALYNNIDDIQEKFLLLREDKEAMRFIENLESRLNLHNPLIRTNILKYIKAKYSNPQDYYYIDLLLNCTNKVSLVLLYIMQDEWSAYSKDSSSNN